MIQMMMMNARNGRSEMTRFVAMALSPFCYLLKDRKRFIIGFCGMLDLKVNRKK